jgi:hypothetical protein
MFINDLHVPREVIDNIYILFADDAKIFRTIVNITLHGGHHFLTVNDCTNLQKDLDKVYEWSQCWQLHFNLGKCSVLRIGKKTSILHLHPRTRRKQNSFEGSTRGERPRSSNIQSPKTLKAG